MLKSIKGFSLVELLTVVAIVIAIVLVAMIQYPRFKARVFDDRALSDLRALVAAQENYFIDNEEYSSNPEELLNLNGGNRAHMEIEEVDENGWAARVFHPTGSKTFCYNFGVREGIVEISGVNASCRVLGGDEEEEE